MTSSIGLHGRIILPPTEAGTVTEKVNLEEALAQHAYERVQRFAVRALYLWNRAVRTGGALTDVHTKVEHAKLQVGRSTIPGYHAAHSEAASGFSENLKENLINQVKKEGATTPVKEGIFRLKGMSDEQMALLLAKPHLAEEVVEKFWPGTSLLDHTEVDVLLNATSCLPAAVNIGCDLRLEKTIRPLIAEINKKLMQGSLTPSDATEEYVQAIKKHFNNVISTLEEEIKNDELSANALERKKRQIFYHKEELRGTKVPSFEALFGKDIFNEGGKLDPARVKKLPLKPYNLKG